jgi:hypothetical protein
LHGEGEIKVSFFGGLTIGRVTLGAAKALYPEFNPVLSLKALAYYGESNLAAMPVEIREFLTTASANVESIETIPKIAIDISPANLNKRTQTQNKSIRI